MSTPLPAAVSFLKEYIKAVAIQSFLDGNEITEAEFVTLCLLYDRKGVRTSRAWLSSFLRGYSGMPGAVITVMTRQGHITVYPHDKDTDKDHLEISPRGRKRIEELNVNLNTLVEKLCADLFSPS